MTQTQTQTPSQATTCTLDIGGMTCASCADGSSAPGEGPRGHRRRRQPGHRESHRDLRSVTVVVDLLGAAVERRLQPASETVQPSPPSPRRPTDAAARRSKP